MRLRFFLLCASVGACSSGGEGSNDASAGAAGVAATGGTDSGGAGGDPTNAGGSSSTSNGGVPQAGSGGVTPGGGGGEPATGGDTVGTDAGAGGPGGSGSGGAGGQTPTSLFPDPIPGRVPVFLAQGHMGRTALSCDDGLTWVADQSADGAIRCFEGIDCDHHAESATGVAYGDGWFVTSWGWGNPGTVRRSANGVDWEDVHSEPTYNGVAFGNGVFVAGSRLAMRSVDGAATWAEIDTELSVWTPRGTGFSPVEGGRFIIGGGGGGEHDVVVSSDDGQSWWHPTTLPDLCGDGIVGITGGPSAIVISRRDGTVCTSTDGGTTFEKITLGDDLTSAAVWTGTGFLAWGRGRTYESSDGVAWTGGDLADPYMELGGVAMAPTGTFVAVRSGWMVWYEEQKFYRSLDGKSWTELPAGAFEGSHPVRRIVFGYAEPTAECPLP